MKLTTEFASVSQKDYITDLCKKLECDEDNYLNIDLTKIQAARIIIELRREWDE